MGNENALIKRFADIQGISYEEAETQIGGKNEEEILNNITKFTTDKINSGELKLNRAQRRALAKKNKGKGKKFATPQEQIDAINDTAKKLNYIDLIQKLRQLNEEKAKENENDTATEDN